MGCAVCKSGRSDVRPPSSSINREAAAATAPTGGAPPLSITEKTNRKKAPTSTLEAQGSSTTLPVTISPARAAGDNTPIRQAGTIQIQLLSSSQHCVWRLCVYTYDHLRSYMSKSIYLKGVYVCLCLRVCVCLCLDDARGRGRA